MADDKWTPADSKRAYLNNKQDSGFLTDLLMSIYDSIVRGETPESLGQQYSLPQGPTIGENRRTPPSPYSSFPDSIIGGLSDAALFSTSKDRFYNQDPQTVSDAITNAASILEVAASRAKGDTPMDLVGKGLPKGRTPGEGRRTPQSSYTSDPLISGLLASLTAPSSSGSSQTPADLARVRGLPPKQEGPVEPGFLSSMLDNIMAAVEGMSEPDPRAAMQPAPQAPSNDIIAQLVPPAPAPSAMPMGTSMNPLSTSDLQALSSPGTLTFSSNPDGTISSGQGFTGQGSFSKGGPTKDVFYERLFGNSARQSQFAQQKAMQVQALNAQINQMRQIQDQWYSKRRDPALVQLVADTFGSISNMEKAMEIKADMARAAQYEAQRAAKRQQEIAAIIGQ